MGGQLNAHVDEYFSKDMCTLRDDVLTGLCHGLGWQDQPTGYRVIETNTLCTADWKTEYAGKFNIVSVNLQKREREGAQKLRFR